MHTYIHHSRALGSTLACSFLFLPSRARARAHFAPAICRCMDGSGLTIVRKKRPARHTHGTHARTHAQIHTNTQRKQRTSAHTRAHTHMYPLTYTRTCKHTCARAHTHIHTHTHTQARTGTHARSATHTHTSTHRAPTDRAPTESQIVLDGYHRNTDITQPKDVGDASITAARVTQSHRIRV